MLFWAKMLETEYATAALATAVRDTMNQTDVAGGCSLTDMLDVQRDYRDTYRLYINSRADY